MRSCTARGRAKRWAGKEADASPACHKHMSGKATGGGKLTQVLSMDHDDPGVVKMISKRETELYF